MRKVVSVGLMIMLAIGAESGLAAAAQSAGAVTGTARTSTGQPVANAPVEIRDADTGEVVGKTVTDQTGAFTSTGLRPGNYVAEVLDGTGKLQGVSMPFTLAPGASATTSVMTIGSLIGSTAGGGFGLFGMGPVTTMTVLGAAAAASVTAVVTTRPDASPSR